MNLFDRRARGVRARLALEDSVLGEVFKEVETDIHNAWASAMTERTRERLHAELRALAKVRSKLAEMASHAPRD
ncbi:MAG: hypothetical protein IPM41_16320 [Sphingomonadales bacterium]|jgi:hypothetical protein|nr:hypothetical protein [Sphingomonadales bacterium]